jgi:hypothetical protein
VAAESHRVFFLTPSANAHSLLAGGPVASVRRRLKVGSILYDNVVLESGVYRAQAGPGGSTNSREAFRPDHRPGWQTSRERSAVMGKAFSLAVGIESSPGVPATTMSPILASESQISWAATLDPFSLELPVGCDWVQWVGRPPRVPEEISKQARCWAQIDERNKVLAERFPAHFVRSRIIVDTNNDLALAAAEGWMLSADPLHSEVLSCRLGDQEGWRLEGFALPFLVPAVGDLPWDVIGHIRRDQGMRTLRHVLRDVEAEALETATSEGDLEATVHRLVEGELARANEAADAVGATIKKTVTGLVIATGAGFATMSVTGPLGVVVTAGAASTLGTVLDLRAARRSKRAKAWIGALTTIKTAAGQ